MFKDNITVSVFSPFSPKINKSRVYMGHRMVEEALEEQAQQKKVNPLKNLEDLFMGMKVADSHKHIYRMEPPIWQEEFQPATMEEIADTMKVGIKETEGKLNYELDWGFIQQLAERMSQNKGKYEPYNWTRKMNVEKLKQSLFRHVIELMKGKYEDDSRELGHLESIALNAMMINYQLKNNSK